MSKPTLTEVYNALGVLERAGMLEKMQMKQTRITQNTHLTASETVAALDKPIRKKRRRMTKEDIGRSIKMYNDEGMSQAAIGNELGFSATCIARNMEL